MGYDHMRDEDKGRMRAMEEKALNSAGIGRVTDGELVAMAREAMAAAYVPYSHYPVGAALLCRDGRVFKGCNVENASFGAANCAERTALFKAVSEGAREFSAIAITAEKSMAWPCGICRQALYEFAPDLRVIVAWGERREEAILSDLLPHGFGPGSMTPDTLE
jgi:cytidine deaminase